jgi:hypothetical protein
MYCVRWALTFAMTTAAQIMFDRPNSVDETPAIWPVRTWSASRRSNKEYIGPTEDVEPADDEADTSPVLDGHEGGGGSVSVTLN